MLTKQFVRKVGMSFLQSDWITRILGAWHNSMILRRPDPLRVYRGGVAMPDYPLWGCCASSGVLDTLAGLTDGTC